MADIKMIHDPEFYKILGDRSKEFIMTDRKELLNILDNQGIEALKNKLISDIKKAG